MWVCTVYRSTSVKDPSKKIEIEMMVGALTLGKPDGLLALVQGEEEETAVDIARSFAGKLGLELEL